MKIQHRNVTILRTQTEPPRWVARYEREHDGDPQGFVATATGCTELDAACALIEHLGTYQAAHHV